jgi:integrase
LILRHTFCKNLADKGVRLEMIAALAGHESLETTRRYVEPGQEDLAAAVERLAGGEERGSSMAPRGPRHPERADSA